MGVIESTTRWTLIDGTLDDVHQAIDRALLADELDVAALFRQIEAQFDALFARLVASALSKSACDDALVALAFYVDELVLERLASSQYRLQTDWPLLRRFEQNERFGGDAFFARAEALSQSADPSDARRFVMDTYLYCLNRGFVGCFAARPEEIARHRSELWRARGAPEVNVVTEARTPRAVGNVAPFWLLACVACILVLASFAAAYIASVGATPSTTGESSAQSEAGRTNQ
ncbi:MAG: DotU family type IV/VI secretion system protein [Deltaproteobacteria bacterium]|nr:DotU family type IV/VI secretion system protein [Deltaproteobacteria bacterium]